MSDDCSYLQCWTRLDFILMNNISSRWRFLLGSLAFKETVTYALMLLCLLKDVRNIWFQTSILHYLSKGSAMLSFVFMKQQFFMPVMMVMRAIVNADDLRLYKQLIKGQEDNQFFKTYVCLTALRYWCIY